MAITFMTKATNARDFQTQIDNLNTKLDNVAKNLTYFDFYNIVDVTVNKNNFSAQVNALTPNTSLIINSEPFFLNNVYYNDMVDALAKNALGIPLEKKEFEHKIHTNN